MTHVNESAIFVKNHIPTHCNITYSSVEYTGHMKIRFWKLSHTKLKLKRYSKVQIESKQNLIRSNQIIKSNHVLNVAYVATF